MQRNGTRTTISSLVALAALAATGAADVPEDCRHLGADWRPPRVVNVGATQCPKTQFSLTIGVGDQGGQVTVTYHGCPSFVDMEPGHGELVQRLHKNPVGPTPLAWTRQRYKADCGGLFRSASCKPEGTPTDLHVRVNHWAEEACAVVPPVSGT